jgi:hypothetical protein
MAAAAGYDIGDRVYAYYVKYPDRKLQGLFAGYAGTVINPLNVLSLRHALRHDRLNPLVRFDNAFVGQGGLLLMPAGQLRRLK